MLRRASMLTASLLMFAAVSACAVGSGDGQEPPQSQAPTADVDPALKVESPKNLKGFADACQLLTPEQRSALQIDGQPAPGASEYNEPSCHMNGENLTTYISINTNQGGMTSAHERQENFDNFAPTEVSGYPAVQVNSSTRVCTVATGISDDQSVDVYYGKNLGESPEMSDPCGYAKKIAAEVIKNIPAA